MYEASIIAHEKKGPDREGFANLTHKMEELFTSVALVELFYASFGINECRLPRVERVTRRTCVDVHLFDGRTRIHYGSASACNGRVFVLRMDVFFHDFTYMSVNKRPDTTLGRSAMQDYFPCISCTVQFASTHRPITGTFP